MVEHEIQLIEDPVAPIECQLGSLILDLVSFLFKDYSVFLDTPCAGYTNPNLTT